MCIDKLKLVNYKQHSTMRTNLLSGKATENTKKSSLKSNQLFIVHGLTFQKLHGNPCKTSAYFKEN